MDTIQGGNLEWRLRSTGALTRRANPRMRNDRLAWLGRLGKVIIALALIATIGGKELTLTVEFKGFHFSFELTGQ